MSTPAIEVEDLTKQFAKHRALDGLTFDVPQGSIFGFLGPNGAGKTTTIRILLGLARASAGQARILGIDCLSRSSESNRSIGFLPDVPSFYSWMRARDYLEFVASLFDLRDPQRSTQIDMLLDLAGLTGVHTRIGGYSRGMKQRLGVAQALVGSPKLLILDEPTSALDPMGRHEVLSLIERLRGQATVFFSTHILSDVERVCDRVAVLSRGRVVAADATEALRAQYGGSQKIRLELADPAIDVPTAIPRQPWLTRIARDQQSWLLDVTDMTAAQYRLPVLAAERGWGIRRLEPVAATLEEVFVNLIEQEAQR